MHKIIYWIYAARPQTLVASISPVLISSSFCYKLNSFNLLIFFNTLFAAITIQIITNFINDLFDYKKGADKNRVGPKRMVQSGHLTEREIIKAIFFMLSIAVVIGLYLVKQGGLPILLIGLSSFCFAYLYTATKFSIAYNGLGEIFVFLYFGIIATMGTFYLQTLKFNYNVLLLGIIVGCLNVCLLIVNNLRDIKQDTKSNKKTLVVILGERFGKLEFVLINLIPFIILFNSNFFVKYNSGVYVLIIVALYIVWNILFKNKFLANKALPLMSFYIVMFSTFLIYLILK